MCILMNNLGQFLGYSILTRIMTRLKLLKKKEFKQINQLII